MASPENDSDKECEDVESTCLSEVCYDEAKAALDVTFAETGVTHRYYDVPDGVARALVRSPSKGRFYNKRIKGQFRRRRLAGS